MAAGALNGTRGKSELPRMSVAGNTRPPAGFCFAEPMQGRIRATETSNDYCCNMGFLGLTAFGIPAVIGK